MIFKYTKQYQGHAENSFDDEQRLRILLGLKKYLQRSVAVGLNYNTIKNTTRPDKQTLFVLEAVDLPGTEKVGISELARISNIDFKNFRRRHLKNLVELSSDCLVNPRAYAQNIKRDSGIAVFEDFENRITEEKSDF